MKIPKKFLTGSVKDLIEWKKKRKYQGKKWQHCLDRIIEQRRKENSVYADKIINSKLFELGLLKHTKDIRTQSPKKIDYGQAFIEMINILEFAEKENTFDLLKRHL